MRCAPRPDATPNLKSDSMTTRKMYDEGIYRVVENPDDKTAGIELTGGNWDGLGYQYGQVQMEDGTPHLNFQRTIRRVPHGTEPSEEGIEELLNNEELNTLMGDILVELIEHQAEKEKNEQRDSKGTD